MPQVLVVEDEPITRKALVRLIRQHGHQVDEAESVANGAAKLIAHVPRCMVLDLMLPDGVGTALLRHVRDQGLPVRVAVVTAAVDPAILSDVEALHPDALFRKPLDLDALTQWLDRAA